MLTAHEYRTFIDNLQEYLESDSSAILAELKGFGTMSPERAHYLQGRNDLNLEITKELLKFYEGKKEE